MGRIEKASMGRRGAGARTAMEKDDRSTQRIARDFPIHRVDVVELEHAALMRLDLRIELANRRGRYALGTHGSGLDPRALQHGVEQHVAAGAEILGGRVLDLVVAEAVLAGN